MDRQRAESPVYVRQFSGGASAPSSPAHPRAAAAVGTIANHRRKASAAASARLAQAMMRKKPEYDTYYDDDNDGDDDLVPAAAAPSVGGFAGRTGGGYGRFRSGSPSVAAPAAATAAATGSLGGGAVGANSGEAMGAADFKLGRNIVEPVPANRSSSAGRPSLTVRTNPVVPQTKPTLRTPNPIPPIEPQVEKRKEKRFFPDGHLNKKETGDLREASALEDKVDMLEEENYRLLEKLQLAEDKCKDAEARSMELEKQVKNLGEGVSLEARLLSRKEAALRQREEAMKAAMRNKDDKGEEIAALKQQLQSANLEVASAAECLKAAELEANSLRSMTQRMILNEEEMEEVVLKRCWLARYWSLAEQHGIFPEIAKAKHDYWSSLAPAPFEYVTSAGQKAKNESRSNGYDVSGRRDESHRGISDVAGEGNVESMLAVEKGLRELASLKVEDAVILVMAQHRRPNLPRESGSDFRSPGDPKFIEEIELSQEEAEDVIFKQSWLAYFWRRAGTHGIEEDIADERLQFWIDQISQTPTSHDTVDVERGLIELRKLSIEQQLWDASRKEMDTDKKVPEDEENS